jgi:hypothetical protein
MVDFSCKIKSSNPGVKLAVEIWLDNNLLQTIDWVQDNQINQSIDPSDGPHQLRWVLKNKLPDHTSVVDGKIVNDVLISITDFVIEDIACDQVLHKLARYQHDFNGTGPVTQEGFWGTMGCNGSVVLEFSSPIYLWLLEHM